MLLIKIKAAKADVRPIQTKNGVKEVAEQVGFIEQNEEVRKVRIPIDIEGGQAPYPVGTYTLHESSFEVGKYQDLGINRFRIALVPVAAQSKAAA